MWLEYERVQIQVKPILVFRCLYNAGAGGRWSGSTEFLYFYSNTEWKNKRSLSPCLVVGVAAGPVVPVSLYIIRTGIRGVPWLWNHTGGSSCCSVLENDTCRQDTVHQKLMAANGTVGLNSLHSARYSRVLRASRSGSLQKPVSVCFGEKHTMACILFRG